MKRLFVVAFLGPAFISGQLTAGPLADYLPQILEAQQKEEEARCGSSPPPPSWYDRSLSTEKHSAFQRYQQCLAKLHQERRVAGERVIRENRQTVLNVHMACRDAVKKLVRSPDTVSFASYKYDPLFGFNSAGVDITDGGYSVEVSGSHVGGDFRVKCYMDKRFVVSAVR